MSEESQNTYSDSGDPTKSRTKSKSRIYVIVTGGVAFVILAAFLIVRLVLPSDSPLVAYDKLMKPISANSDNLMNQVNDLRNKGISDVSFAAVIGEVLPKWKASCAEASKVQPGSDALREAHKAYLEYCNDQEQAYQYYYYALQNSDAKLVLLGNDFQDKASGKILNYAAQMELIRSQQPNK